MIDPERITEADYRVHPDTGIPTSARRTAGWRRLLVPAVAILGVLSKAKGLLVPLKLLFKGPLIGPIVSAVVSIGAYAVAFGWQFGVGIVGMLFIHEMGHVLILRRYGVPATAPIFIPFLGAFIGMRQLPRDAVMEAYVGLGGPVLGSLGALAAFGIYQVTDHPLWLVLAYLGVLLNLFNLLPIPPLDGGRAVAAISRWIWLLGLVGLGVLIVVRLSPILLLVALFGATELWGVWRRSRTNPDYYQVPLAQRLTVSAIYFGLTAFLVYALIKLAPMVYMGRPL